MQAEDFVLELGCEELPPGDVDSAVQQLQTALPGQAFVGPMTVASCGVGSGLGCWGGSKGSWMHESQSCTKSLW